MVREAEEHAAEDKARREAAEVRNTAEQLAYSIEKLIKDNDDKLPDDVKTEVQADVDALKTALAGEDDDGRQDRVRQAQREPDEARRGDLPAGAGARTPRPAAPRTERSRRVERRGHRRRRARRRRATRRPRSSDGSQGRDDEATDEPERRARRSTTRAKIDPETGEAARRGRPTTPTEDRRRGRTIELSDDDLALLDRGRARPGRRVPRPRRARRGGARRTSAPGSSATARRTARRSSPR